MCKGLGGWLVGWLTFFFGYYPSGVGIRNWAPKPLRVSIWVSKLITMIIKKEEEANTQFWYIYIITVLTKSNHQLVLYITTVLKKIGKKIQIYLCKTAGLWKPPCIHESLWDFQVLLHFWEPTNEACFALIYIYANGNIIMHEFVCSSIAKLAID